MHYANYKHRITGLLKYNLKALPSAGFLGAELLSRRRTGRPLGIVVRVCACRKLEAEKGTGCTFFSGGYRGGKKSFIRKSVFPPLKRRMYV